jgi:hypothetical protein
MKKLKTNSKVFLFASILLASASCKPDIKDLCDCAKKSANDYMLRGEYPEPLTKIAIPCSELADKFDQTSTEYKTNINALEKELADSIENKGLFLVDGKLPEFPTVPGIELIKGTMSGITKEVRYKFLKNKVQGEFYIGKFDEIGNKDYQYIRACYVADPSVKSDLDNQPLITLMIPKDMINKLKSAYLIDNAKLVIVDSKTGEIIKTGYEGLLDADLADGKLDNAEFLSNEGTRKIIDGLNAGQYKVLRKDQLKQSSDDPTLICFQKAKLSGVITALGKDRIYNTRSIDIVVDKIEDVTDLFKPLDVAQELKVSTKAPAEDDWLNSTYE